ncbi:hypothetical protein KCP71_21605 [Salmonella enterica subsp. enterica]|nr:hypothetical protein KCP71_21605 [Salmonella enterica subsp. enterica]
MTLSRARTAQDGCLHSIYKIVAGVQAMRFWQRRRKAPSRIGAAIGSGIGGLGHDQPQFAGKGGPRKD